MSNLGNFELVEALARVSPFTSKEAEKPVLNCVKLEIKEGKLTLVGGDGFRLGIANLNLAEGKGEALIDRANLKGIVPPLRKAKRMGLAIQEKANASDELLGKDMVIDTELVRYSLPSKNFNLSRIWQDYTE